MERTIKTKIESKDLEDTLDQYFQAYKFCVNKGFELHTSNKKKLHNATYKQLRKDYPKLPSALLQTIRDVACENLWAVKLKNKPTPKNKFIRYDGRTFSFKNGKVSISTINGRQKFDVKLPKFAEKYKDWDCKAGTVVSKRGQLWLNLIFNKEVAFKEPKTFLGIDRGINNIAVCSDNSFYNSKQLKRIKGKYQYLKTRLQSKGTPSAKRHLKKLSGKEKRFVKDVNHRLSKEIAAKPYDCFVLEDLKKLPRNKGRKFNKLLGGWSYFQLGNFIQYKAEELGKTTIKVNPKYTSQTCSNCGFVEKNNRNGNKFKCKECGFELNADLNASRNIVNLGKAEINRLQVIQPIVTTSELVTSPHALAVGR